jgi:hypothetical protein
VVKAKCIETGETKTFNNHMFQTIELLETPCLLPTYPPSARFGFATKTPMT